MKCWPNSKNSKTNANYSGKKLKNCARKISEWWTRSVSSDTTLLKVWEAIKAFLWRYWMVTITA